jgi:hypothetical protein
MSLICSKRVSKKFSKYLSDIMSNIESLTDENQISEQFLDSLKILRTEY